MKKEMLQKRQILNHPTLQAHLHFSSAKSKTKNAKEPAIFQRNRHDIKMQNISVTDLPAPNSTFAKWRVEEVLVRSVFNLTFVASRQVEVPNPPIRKSSNR
jgi:hypothetical protein